jgi:hypothetical protein
VNTASGKRGLRFLRQNIPGRITVAKWMMGSYEWMDKNLVSAVRAVAKWYFDVIKNILVVVALAYTWRKTGSATVKAVTILSTSIFVAEFLSYPLTLVFAIHTYVGSKLPLLSDFIITILGVIVLAAIMAALGFAALEVVEALFDAQRLIK